MAYSGSCLCGTVQFSISGPIRNIVYCHCSMCRKAQGSAFAVNGIVSVDDFGLTSGTGSLSAYESSPGQTKYFCRQCGSPIYSSNKTRPDQVRIRMGVLDPGVHERPEAHIFASSRADWDEICDSLPQYDQYEPGR